MNDMERELLQGTVQTVAFQNAENGYTVLKLLEESGKSVTVVGIIPMAVPGEQLMITGRWVQHSTYGKQFEAEFLERLMPEHSQDILAYLSSRAVKGIGPVTAKKIVDAFGNQALDVLENDPERLAQLPGVTRKKAFAMSDCFRKQSGMRRLLEFLSSHHLSAGLAVKLYRSYGEAALDAVCADPYLLTDSYYGAGFTAVDAFALELGVSAEDDQRVEAGILFTLSHNLGNGHVFIPMDKLTPAAADLLELSEERIEEGILRLQQQERVFCDALLQRQMVYLPELYEAETYACQRLLSMAEERDTPPKNLPALLERINSRRAEPYAPAQLRAMEEAASRQLLIVTGGPGTGKTTTMAGILQLYELMGIKTVLAAPTGRAAKRLTQCTGKSAATIHRLLESQYDAESDSMLFNRDEGEPLKAEAVIIDEASMVDLPLFHSLLKAMKPGCRLVLVGDPDQLPSVGPGNVFSDIIRSGRVAVVRLTEIFRQARESLIVMNAHAVNNGEMPQLGIRDRDFFFLRRRDGESVTETIRDLCSTRLPKNMGIPSGEIQVLSPTRKGTTGTVNLNKILQEALNPPADGKKEKVYGGFTYRDGDRVMQIHNNYDITWKCPGKSGFGTGIFNGDIGTIRTIDHGEEIITIDFDGHVAEYGFDMLSELEPAYAMTVHKSQGSEYKAVILSLLGGSPYLLSRNILYTAITRAKELLILVGGEETIAAMVQNDKQQRRYSGLKLRLEGRAEQ